MRTWVTGVALVIVGLGVGYYFGHRGVSNIWGDTSVRAGGYTYVNPLLACDIADDTMYPGYDGLRSKLVAEIQKLTEHGTIARASVYVRDMNQGRWTGVQPDATFIPGSLMKVPLLISYLQDSQVTADLLSKRLTLSHTDENAGETIKATTPVTPGGTYSVQELLNAMIISSDNNAANALIQNVSSSTLGAVYDQFGLPAVDDRSETMGPKAYMRLFRILYNASYLWRGNSQKALELLSQSDFTDGIVAGVPAGTSVAHKFGEREIAAVNATTGARRVVKRELHDCGIVYYGARPYGICIMTEGADYAVMETAIASLSKIVFSEVASGILSR